MPTETRKRLVVRNSVYSMLSWMVPLIVGPIVTPIVVRGLGNEHYGLYAIILGFISYSFAFGIGKTAAKYVAEYRGRGESESLAEIISSILWLSLGAGAVAVVALFVFSGVIVRDVLLIQEPLQETGRIALMLAGVTILFTMVSQVFQFVLQGMHRFDRYLLVTNISAIAVNLGSVVIVLSGRGITSLIIWNMVMVAFTGIFFYSAVRQWLPEFHFRARIERKYWIASLRYSASIISYEILANVLLLFERAWVTRKFGTEALTFYVVPMMPAIYFQAFIASVTFVLFPVVNELIEDPERLAALYRLATKVIVAASVLFMVSMAICGHTLLAVWVGADFAERSGSIAAMHAVTFGLVSIGCVAWQVSESFRHPSLNVVVTAVWLSIAIPLMIVLSSDRGSEGVAIARMIGALAFIPFVIVVERRFISMNSGSFWAGLLLRTVLAGSIMAGVEWLVIANMGASWASLIIATGAGSAAAVAVLLMARVFDERERRALILIGPGARKV